MSWEWDYIKGRNQDAGHYFFDAPTMRFFRTRLHDEPVYLGDDKYLFVTSEQDTEDGAWGGQRRFSVRRFDHGKVSTVGEFGQYDSQTQALAAIEEICRQYWEEGTESWNR